MTAQSQTVKDTYKRVIDAEADALRALSQAMPPDFAACVDIILEMTGRVVVSGIGKSGHIGRKISATLASTGTPSLFVHPSEASHGDLGSIGADDICLLISNSGETRELGDLLAYTKRFAIPLVAITSKPESSLARAADYLLALPNVDEACPMGLAPTSSTTMTLALGDALAVALMEAQGFGAEHFAAFHPGGKLGAQLRKVDDLMHRGPALPCVSAQTAMSDTLLEMTSKGLGITSVVDESGKLVGIVTDGDLRRNMARLMQCRAGDVATPSPVTMRGDRLAVEALHVLQERKISALVIVDDADKPVGVVHIHDLLRAGVA